MTTIIQYGVRTSLEDAPAPIRVSESVNDVVIDVNNAKGQNHQLVALTDADTGKEISIDVGRVVDIREE